MLTKSTRCTVIFGTLSLVVYACQLLFFFTYYATELPVLNDSDHTAEPVTPSHPHWQSRCNKMSQNTSTFEHSYYIGNYLGAILYGFELTLYYLVLRGLFRRGNRNSARSRRFCSIYSTVMVLLSTINVASNAIWGEEMWITHRDDPGGVERYIETEVSVWYETLASAAVITCVFLGDALLVYRVFLVYGSSIAVVAIPLIAYIVAFILAVIQVVVSGQPNGNFFGIETIKIAVSYYAISICMNIVLTVLICARLLQASKRISGALDEEAATVYTSAVAILVESAAFYSASGIMFLIPYAMQLQVGILFGQIWTKMSVICPLLIILRVVNGRAWKDNMLATTTPLEFASMSVGVESSTMNQDSHLSHNPLEGFNLPKGSSNTKNLDPTNDTGNPA